jgi:hypothetical protein
MLIGMAQKPWPTAEAMELNSAISRHLIYQAIYILTQLAAPGVRRGINPPARVSGRFAEADVAHFGNIRGTNGFKGHEVVIILGREQPSPRDAERRAMAVW